MSAFIPTRSLSPPRCVRCGGTASVWIMQCACEGVHGACRSCCRKWKIQGWFSTCPNSDEFQVAAAVMGKERP